MKVPMVGIAQSPVTGFVYCSLWPAGVRVVSLPQRLERFAVRWYGYQKSGEVRLFALYSTGFMVLPNCARLSPSYGGVLRFLRAPFHELGIEQFDERDVEAVHPYHRFFRRVPWSWKVTTA